MSYEGNLARQEAADKAAQEIAGSFHAIEPIREETGGEIFALMSDNRDQQAIIEKATALRVLFKSLSYGDYCILESALQRADKHTDFSLERADGTPALQQIYDLLGDLQSNVRSERFLNDALLLLRISFPLGKNVVNASMQEDPQHPLSLDAGRPCSVQHATMNVQLSPEGDDTTRITVSSESPDTRSCLLSEGQTIILGRKLVMNSCFGVNMGDGITMLVSLPVSDKFVSRGAVLIGRHHGRIFIFDRGARNSISATQQDLRVEYDPNAENPNGSLGQSIVSYGSDAAFGV